MAIRETHEPDLPVNWPDGHVMVTHESSTADSRERLRLAGIEVSITDLEDDECVLVALGDSRHYLHSTTARALADKLATFDGKPVSITIHDVSHTAGQGASRRLRQSLERRLAEWNKDHAGRLGFPGV